MNNLREFIHDQVIKIQTEIKAENSSVTFEKVTFFVLFKDGKVDYSDSLSIVEQPDVEYILVLHKIHYTPMLNYYSSCLAPYIYDYNCNEYKHEFNYKGWNFKFTGQDSMLINIPRLIELIITNHKFDIEKKVYFEGEKFVDVCRIISSINECDNSYAELNFHDSFESLERQRFYKQKIKTLELEVHICRNFSKGISLLR